MAKKLDRGQGKAIKWVLKAVSLTIFVGFGLFFSNWALASIDDYFDTYSTGDLTGQGGWATFGAEVSCLVSSVVAFSSPNSVDTSSENTCANYKVFGGEASGSQRFYFYQPSNSPNYNGFHFRIREGTSDRITFLAYKTSSISGYMFIVGCGNDCIKYYNLNTWNDVVVEWVGPDQVRYNLNDTGFTNWFAMAGWAALDRVVLMNAGEVGSPFTLYFDNLGTVIPEPPDFRVWGVSPASGTTITDLSDEIVIGWEGFDEFYQEAYGKISVRFYNEETGFNLGAVWIEPATTTEGQETFTFSDFGLDYANADWYLTARAISGYPNYLMTGDVVSPEYYVEINVEGQDPLYEMSDWLGWYAEKSDKYATPTEAFTSLAGVVSPIFSQIGNFGSIVIDFLDPAEARETGENLSVAIPLLRQYVDEIEMLFGGFPVIQIFLLCMLFIIGAFVVKLILKFIPFLG